MSGYNFDYHYGYEANQYSFYRIPKVLFTDEIFKGLTCEAKVLYGLMLDRMGLSLKNNWVDENNRVYIYFTLEDVQEAISCGQDKGVKLFAELDSEKGIGLIERKKQGMGRPAKIYVKSFIVSNKANSTLGDTMQDNQDIRISEVKTSENPKSLLLENRSQDLEKSEVITSEKPKSRVRKNRSHDFGKTDSNYTDINKTDINDTEYQSIHPSITPSISIEKSESKIYKSSDAYEVYRQMIKDNIEYECLFQNSYEKEDVDEIVELMLETVCSTKKYLQVNSEKVPAEIVKSRLTKLNFSHIEYVMDSLRTNTTKVTNIRGYLLTTLFNSYTSINHHYKAEVNHDFHGGT